MFWVFGLLTHTGYHDMGDQSLGTEVQHALDVLIGPVMSCLGDSNVRLHAAGPGVRSRRLRL